MGARVVVTGLGALSALGRGTHAILIAMREGRDALTDMERFDVRPLHPLRLAGWLRDRWERGESDALEAWTHLAAEDAWLDAGWLDAGRLEAGRASIDPRRIAVVCGTTLGEAAEITRVADAAARAIGARGPRLSVSTACASSANALGLGRDLLLAGDADVVLAGGAEKLNSDIFAGFAALGVLGADKCAPFGEARGTTLGEGAGFVVLEREGEREVAPRAWLLGYGLSSDAWHETSPDPRGEGLARATQSCLQDAALGASDIDYVNAHATGTAANDDAEWRGIQKGLGARASEIPISASKGFFGHAQGAAGVLETIATIACMREGLMPPSLRIGKGRLHGPPDPVPAPRPGTIRVALSNSAAFGGANAVVAIASEPRDRAERARRGVYVLGSAAVATPAGAQRDESELARACGDVDLRGTDPSARYAIAAARSALADASLKLRGALRDRAALFTGVSGPPWASVDELHASLERGLDRASAPAFARSVANAPAGAASRAVGARGPTSTLVADGVAGLFAIAYAARWLGERDDADVAIAGGIDERRKNSTRGEGAAFAVLGREGGGARIAGVAIAASLEEAIARALAGPGLPRVERAHRFGGSEASSLGSALVLLDAARSVREGAPAAIATAAGPQASIAIVVVGGDA
ncbi:MAG: hypothetical protein IT378_02135 [Sandaracinaceae bacterium]|nr:hypothetical protein [Sandaracinaceae bacterium]